MIHPSQVVSIHPYFKVRPGNLEKARAILARFVAVTTEESANLYYHFTIRGDVVFCREAYVGAEGLLVHIDRIGPILADFLQIAEIVRVEIHGSAAEIAKLEGPLAALNPDYYVFECGVAR